MGEDFLLSYFCAVLVACFVGALAFALAGWNPYVGMSLGGGLLVLGVTFDKARQS